MNNKFIKLTCGLSAACLTLSIAVHYQIPANIDPKRNGMEYAEFVPRTPIVWTTALKTHPQLKTKLEEKSPSGVLIESRIQDTRLIGIVRGTRMLAIVTNPSTNKVDRIETGEDWFDSWILEKIEADHVTWRDEKTNERYVQELFKGGFKDKSLLSSVNGN